MHIDIITDPFSLTDALRYHAERRLSYALNCRGDHIQRVVMRLSDINGPRGGNDKRCHLHIMLAGLPDVIIHDTEADLYVAINRAADRAGRTVRRKINRQQTLIRNSRTLVLSEA
jgi:ribosome-associated translation inhibitor RaiA